ncbi:MAG: thiamine/thiamine pyrophosphate ABC transporter permease ThiP [Rhodobacteraceae bacterium]|nr:thiamine/thiamine pyrophosphate ABC transporter permease ThiP [Paracoccaceae bacterium]
MAGRDQSLTVSGVLAASLILILTFGTLAAVGWRAEGAGQLGPADFAAIRFTLWQSFLSATISTILAVPVARALARRRFPGRGLVITLLGAPFILPVIVAIFGLLAIFGRTGVLSEISRAFGGEALNIYGLHGVVLAHVFFNIPLATRLILQGWLAIPAERFRLAASLGFRGRDIARQLEWPMLREVLPGAWLVIFLICLTSFAVALTLGGGPRATTVELAIYQAFRFDFDLGKAALLALIQFGIGGTAALFALRIALPQTAGGGFDRTVERWDARGRLSRWTDVLAIGLAMIFLLSPLTAVFAEGLRGIPDLGAPVFRAAVASVLVALASTALALLLSLSLAHLIVAMGHRRGGPLLEALGYLSIAASPLVVGTGLFILIFPFVSPDYLALPVTALVNATMSLPFVLRSLVPALREVESRYGTLSESLGLGGWRRFRIVTLPRLRRPLGFAAGLTAALSMGDLGVIALFAGPEQATLPLQLYRLMGAYRMEEAAAAALLLLALSVALFWIFDRGGRADADA